MQTVPSSPEAPTVFVVEDDSDQRDGLSLLLQAAGFPVATFDSAEAFLEKHSSEMTGCLLCDLRLPRMDGVSLMNALNSRGNRLPVIVLSGFAETQRVVDAMRAGAVDFLEKPFNPEALIHVVRSAVSGDSSSASLRSEAALAAERVETLSQREREVFSRFSRGTSTKQVADAMGLSPKTIETYRARLLEKLGVTTPSALVRLSVLTSIYPSKRDRLPPR